MYVFDDIFSSSFFLLKCKMTSGNDYSIIDNKIKFMKNSFVSTRVCCCYCCRHTSFEFEWNLFRLPWEITHAKKIEITALSWKKFNHYYYYCSAVIVCENVFDCMAMICSSSYANSSDCSRKTLIAP